MQEEVHDDIFGSRGIVDVISAAQDIDTVLVLEIGVGTIDLSRKERSVIVRFEPLDAIYAGCRAMHIEDFEAMVLVASREDELTVVSELYPRSFPDK